MNTGDMLAINETDKVRLSESAVTDPSWIDQPPRFAAGIGVLTWLATHDGGPAEVARMAVDFDESVREVLDAVRELAALGLVDVDGQRDVDPHDYAREALDFVRGHLADERRG